MHFLSLVITIQWASLHFWWLRILRCLRVSRQSIDSHCTLFDVEKWKEIGLNMDWSFDIPLKFVFLKLQCLLVFLVLWIFPWSIICARSLVKILSAGWGKFLLYFLVSHFNTVISNYTVKLFMSGKSWGRHGLTGAWHWHYEFQWRSYAGGSVCAEPRKWSKLYQRQWIQGLSWTRTPGHQSGGTQGPFLSCLFCRMMAQYFQMFLYPVLQPTLLGCVERLAWRDHIRLVHSILGSLFSMFVFF